MGVLDISQRTVSLGNLGDVRQVDTNTGAVEAANRVAASVRSMNQMRIHAAGGKYLMGQAIGNGLADLGKGATSLSLDMMKMKQIDDQRKEDEFASQFQRGVNAYNHGRGGAADGELPATFEAMYKTGVNEYNNGENGALNADMKDPDEWMRRNQEFRTRYAEKLKSDLGMTDEQMARVQRRLVGFNMGVDNAWSDRKFKVEKAREIGNAKGAREQATNTVLALPPSSSTPEEAQAAASAWKELDGCWNRELDANGVFGEQERESFKRTQALGICQEGVKRFIKGMQAETFGSTDPDAVKSAWDENLKMLEGADDDSFLPPSSWMTGEKGEKVNYLRDALKGADLGSVKKAAIQDFKMQEKTAVAEATSLRRQAINRGREDFYQVESQIRGADTPELRAIGYRRAAERYRETDPRFYNMIMAKADLQERKWEKQKAKNEALAEKQAAADAKHDVLAMATLYQVRPDMLKTEAEKQEWLENRRNFECEYLEMFMRGEIEPQVADKVMSMMDEHYTEEEERAVNAFDARFGFTRGAYPKSTDVTQRLKTYKGKVKVGEKAGRIWGTNDVNIDYEDLQTYRERYLDLLRSAPKGVDKVKFSQECADKVITLYTQDHADEIFGGLNHLYRQAEDREIRLRDQARKQVEDLYRRKGTTKRPAPTAVEPDTEEDDDERDMGGMMMMPTVD